MSRAQLEDDLALQPWFLGSDKKVQDLLLSLPGTPPEGSSKIQELRDCNGFLADLAARPLEGGGVRHERIIDLHVPNLDRNDRPIFGIFVNFEVLNITRNVVYPYQYFSWRQGPDSGTKGVVLIRGAAGVSHVVCLHGFSFAVGAETYDCFGGFGESLSASDDVKRELKEELGLDLTLAQRTIDLGRFHPDRGMTNNKPRLVAPVFDQSHVAKIEQFRDNPDIFEMRSGPIIVPTQRLWGREGFGFGNEDGYFGVCMNRLMCLGAIKQPDWLSYDFAA